MKSILFFITAYTTAFVLSLTPFCNKYIYKLTQKQIQKNLTKNQLFRKSRYTLITLFISIAVTRVFPQINLPLPVIAVLIIALVVLSLQIHCYAMANYNLYKTFSISETDSAKDTL